MYLNGYSVRVVGGTEQNDGYVEMKHGQTYKIVLKNNHNARCDAQVVIDGKEVGIFRIGANSNFTLERPANEAKHFTFYEKGTSEANQARAYNIDHGDLGLIQVTFKPEKIKTFVKPEKVWGTWNGSTTTPRGVYRSSYTEDELDLDLTPRGMKSTYLGMDEDTICSTSSVTRGVVSNSSQRQAGMTGLSGHSNQQFQNVANLDYDVSKFITISLRLVSVHNDIQEMKPITRGNPVPPPVD